MNPVTSQLKRPIVGNLLAGVLGGLVVLAVGGVLIATDVIETGDTERQVVRETLARPGGDEGSGRSAAEIYRQEGRGVVFVQARGVTD